MYTRRAFVSGLAGLGLAAPMFRPDALARAARAGEDAAACPACDLATNEDYWSQIQRCFDADRTVINFNNGGVCPTPTHVLEQMIRDLRFTNEAPANHLWSILEPRVETARRELAAVFGCDPEEIALTRNASEAMETLILGADLKKGDEVVVTDQNYPRMLTAWDQRVRRDGIVLKTVTFKVPLPSPSYFVDRIREAITPRTRIIELTHITNYSGQILPIRDIVAMAREKGIEVFIDGAHAFAHFPFTRDELGVDYYGTSLHKWLLAPIGTGFLYVRRENIEGLWELTPTAASRAKDIRKFEEIGTHPAANHNAIAEALTFHEGIGIERKSARLRYLRDRWAKRLVSTGKFKVHTSLDPAQSCAIGTVQVLGVDTSKAVQQLWDKWRIIATPINHAEYTGIRVTPNVYTTLEEIDTFGDAMEKIVATS